jgi:hypothetical protein
VLLDRPRLGIRVWLGIVVLGSVAILTGLLSWGQTVGLFPADYQDVTFKDRLRAALGIYADHVFSKNLFLAGIPVPSQLGTYFLRLPATVLAGRFPPRLDHLQLDIRQQHLDLIQEERRQTIESYILRSPTQYNAQIRYGTDRYRVRIRLKGDQRDHWLGPDRWSFRVSLRDDRTLRNLSEFSLQKPYTRVHPYDFFFQHWLRAAGNIAPRHDYVRVSMNGDNWGIMDLEERIGKVSLERLGRKDSLLLRLHDQTDWYYNRTISAGLPGIPTPLYDFAYDLAKERTNSTDPLRKLHFSYIRQRIDELIAGKIPASTIFDLRPLARAFIAAIAWNNSHSIGPANTEFYFNPFTLKLETIALDQRTPVPFGKQHRHQGRVENPGWFYRAALREKAFRDLFLSELPGMVEAFARLPQEWQNQCSIFPLECTEFEKVMGAVIGNLGDLEENAAQVYDRIQAEATSTPLFDYPPFPPPGTLPEVDVDYPKHVLAAYYRDGRLLVANLLPYEVRVDAARRSCPASEQCNEENLLPEPVLLPVGLWNENGPRKTEIELPAFPLDRDHPLTVTTSLFGRIQETVILIDLSPQVENPLTSRPTLTEIARELPFVELAGKTFVLQPGTWTVRQPLVVPRGYALRAGPGTELLFEPDAYLLSFGPLLFAGTQDNPVILKPSSATWKGIYVLETEEESSLEHVRIEATDFFRDGILSLTGGVNFYKAPVSLKHVAFSETVAEDALNTIHSPFTMEQVLFEGTVSDAFDSDFCEGTVRDTTFRRIGGDGFDTSGSRITATGLRFSDVRDKAISGGEASQLVVSRSSARQVGTGVAAKDGSTVRIEELTIEETLVAPAMSYTKKDFYGPARLEISSSDFDGDVLVQIGNEGRVDGRPVSPRPIDVDALYATGPMRKEI